MLESRVSVLGEATFNPREWLRREVLWASLMTPYKTQLDGWLNGTQISQHAGNVTRRDYYAREANAEALSLSLFNQGKNVAGLVSASVLFKVTARNLETEDTAALLLVQADRIDRVLTTVPVSRASDEFEANVFDDCIKLATTATAQPEGQFGRTHRYLKASRLMVTLAASEATAWVESSQQTDDTATTQLLVIQNGGYPRSAGPRVDSLQPIFNTIIASQDYQALSTQ